ncbi:unnamed protein product, partial [Ascophyllum nodosum]
GGGAEQVLIVSNGYLYLKNLEIVNGNASAGGAIFVASESELFLEDVSFSSNTAKDMGGAIYAVSSNITLASTTFSYSVAGYGGAIFTVNSNVYGSVSVSFHGNSANYGGAVYMLSSILFGSGNMALTSNNAAENGGALYIAEDSYVGWNMQPVFPSTSQYYTSSTYSYSGKGGAIYAEDTEMSWSGSMLLKHNSAEYGGALYLENYVNVGAKGPTTFYSNNALYDGGAIGAANEVGTYSGHSSLMINAAINFTGNAYGGNGGAIDLSDIRIYVYGEIVFSANSAASFGGALYASQKVYGPTLTGVIFSKNTAEAGGAVFFSAVGTNGDDSPDYEISHSSWSTFIECRFDGNSASSTGGAIHSIVGKDLVLGTNFTNNVANFGGAL